MQNKTGFIPPVTPMPMMRGNCCCCAFPMLAGIVGLLGLTSFFGIRLARKAVQPVRAVDKPTAQT